MRRFLGGQVRLSAVALVISFLLTVPPLAAAQSVDQPCSTETVPQDGFQSPGIGLTMPELEALYGERQPGQGPFFFDYHGLHLSKVGCDLILSFPQEGVPDEVGMDEFALTEGLLPADAEYVGSFERGSPLWTRQPATLWHSASLAERFDQLGEHRGGDILILYTYQEEGLDTGPIYYVEVRTLELPD
jgi:hypothetical protein